jgi:hypothetical protein
MPRRVPHRWRGVPTVFGDDTARARSPAPCGARHLPVAGVVAPLGRELVLDRW